MAYRIDWTRQALKDALNIERAGLKRQVSDIQKSLKRNPYEPIGGHRFEKIILSTSNAYSRRINKQHRFIYTVRPNTDGLTDKDGNLYDGIVRVISMWGHP
jgi:Txe/YoeB family toxin of toxin-antitoxin system